MNDTGSLKDSFIEWYLKSPIENPVCLNLHLKKGIEIKTDTGCSIKPISDTDITMNIRHFMNRMNQKVYGKKFRKEGRRLSIIPIIEGTQWIRNHTHMVIQRPDELDLRSFEILVEDCWEKTMWGYSFNDITEMQSIGYLEYILKPRTKRNIFDSIDWDNLYLN